MRKKIILSDEVPAWATFIIAKVSLHPVGEYAWLYKDDSDANPILVTHGKTVEIKLDSRTLWVDAPYSETNVELSVICWE